MKIKNIIHIFLMLLSSTLITSCKGGAYNSDNESDEDIKKNIRNLNIKVRESTQEVEQHKSVLNSRKTLKDNLGKRNQYLAKELAEKKDQVKDILKEIYDDSRNKTSYNASCQKCGKQVTITYDKFYEMTRRFNTGWTRHYTQVDTYENSYHYTYKWFLWFKWGYERHLSSRKLVSSYQTTDKFEFHTCPQCMKQEDMDKIVNFLADNVEEIAKIEAEMVKKQLELQKSQATLEERDSSLQGHKKQSVRKLEIKNERDEATQQAIEAQKKATEKERENERLKEEAVRQERENERLKEAMSRQKRENQASKKSEEEQKKEIQLNTAKKMIAKNLDLDTIMEITGLHRAEIEILIKK